MLQKLLRKWLVVIVALTLLPLYACADVADVQWITVPFSTPTGGGKPYSWAFPYSDDFFLEPSGAYNQQLAQSSLGLALSAFRQTEQDLQHKDQAVRDFLTAAGFEALQAYEFDIETSIDTIASIIGHKTLSDGSTLIAMAISGGGYQNEWQSNFTISTQQYEDGDVFHDGFASAMGSVTARLMEYEDVYTPDTDVKLWLTGYSRAAAVGNLSAFAADNFGLAKGGLYAYTFATPRCVVEEDVLPCTGLFNIVGGFDPVACVPFPDWGYGRFGTTLYLPAQEITPDYAARKAAVQPVYKALTGLDYWNNTQANWLCAKVMQALDDVMRNAGEYRDDLQQLVVDTLQTKGGLLAKLLTARRLIGENAAASEMLGNISFNIGDLLSTVVYELTRQRLGFTESQWSHGVSLTAELMREHCPDVYVAWMFSQDNADALFVTELGYHQVLLSGDFSVSAAYDDGTPIVPASFTLGEARLISLPADRDCTLTLTANRDTSFTGFVTERVAQRLSARLLLYPEIAVADEGKLVLPLPAEPKAAAELYTPVLNGVPETLALDSDTIDLRSGFPEMDAVYSGDAATHFLHNLAVWLIVLFVLLLLLLVLLIVKLVRGCRRRRRTKGTLEDGFSKKSLSQTLTKST